MRLYTAFAVLFLFSAPIAHAGTDPISLRGLKGVAVIVEDLKPEVEQNGLTTGAIQTDAELKLRQASIPVLASGEGGAFLHISVNVLPTTGDIWPYAITVELARRFG